MHTGRNIPSEYPSRCRQRGILRGVLMKALRSRLPNRSARTIGNKNVPFAASSDRRIEARRFSCRTIQGDGIFGCAFLDSLKFLVVSRRHSTSIGCRSRRHDDTISSQAQAVVCDDLSTDNICIVNTNAVAVSIYINKALNVKIDVTFSSSTSLGIVGINRKVNIFRTGREARGVASASRGLDLCGLDKVILRDIDNLANIRSVFGHLIACQIAAPEPA